MNLDFVDGTGRWDELLDDHDTHMALVYRDRAARNLMQLKPGWQLLYEDGTSALFADQDWVGLESLKTAIAANPNPPVNHSFP